MKPIKNMDTTSSQSSENQVASSPPKPDLTSISAYLHFGYLPQVKNISSAVIDVSTRKEDTNITRGKYIDIKELIKEGVRMLKNAIGAEVSNACNSSNHILLLSGGLDSRAVFGGLIEAGLKHQTTVVTYGVPGSLDYEIGCSLSKQLGMRHEPIDLNQVSFEQESLERVAGQSISWISVFQAFYHRLIPERFGKRATYWSGFCADALSGKNLPIQENKTWEDAKAYFVNLSRHARSAVLTAPDFRSGDVLPSSPMLDRRRLSYDDQLNFAFLQDCGYRPAILPNGYEYRTPHLQPTWASFLVNVPRQYRLNQYLYKEILKEAYRELFSFPSKTNYGLGLNAPRWKCQLHRLLVRARYSVAHRFFPSSSWSVHPATNYIDFDKGLRERDDLKTVVYESLQDLKRRDIVGWIDIDGIWTRHQQNIGNYSDALTLLASLELNLKAQEVRAK